MIQVARVRRAGLLDAAGPVGAMNVQGEEQQKLDVYANEALLHCLGVRDAVAVLVSEENDQPVVFDRAPETGKYIVIFDPLDGSSNIDVNVSVGTIFSIFRRPEESEADLTAAALQPGWKQVAAGYVVYGSSTVFVYTTGRGVFGFTLDPDVGAYVLSQENIRMPEHGKFYSVNEGNARSFPAEYQEYLERLRTTGTLGLSSMAPATSVRWSRTSTAFYSQAVSFCTHPRKAIHRESSGCSTKPIRWHSSRNKPAAPLATELAGLWRSSRRVFISEHRLRSAAGPRWTSFNAAAALPCP